MPQALVRIIPARSRSGGPAKCQGTKVLMPDGSAMPGVTSVVLRAAVDDIWRAEISCLINPPDVTCLADLDYRRIRYGKVMLAWFRVRGWWYDLGAWLMHYLGRRDPLPSMEERFAGLFGAIKIHTAEASRKLHDATGEELGAAAHAHARAQRQEPGIADEAARVAAYPDQHEPASGCSAAELQSILAELDELRSRISKMFAMPEEMQRPAAERSSEALEARISSLLRSGSDADGNGLVGTPPAKAEPDRS